MDDSKTTSDSDSVSEQGISSANIHSCTDCGRPSIKFLWVEEIERSVASVPGCLLRGNPTTPFIHRVCDNHEREDTLSNSI